jgi:chromosome segregation ATPase
MRTPTYANPELEAQRVRRNAEHTQAKIAKALPKALAANEVRLEQAKAERATAEQDAQYVQDEQARLTAEADKIEFISAADLDAISDLVRRLATLPTRMSVAYGHVDQLDAQAQELRARAENCAGYVLNHGRANRRRSDARRQLTNAFSAAIKANRADGLVALMMSILPS